jgi:hypothetical protein
MHRHLLICGVEIRIIAKGFRNASLSVVRDDELRRALKELKRPHVCADPTCQPLVRGGLGVGVRTGSHHRDEQKRPLYWPAATIVNRNSIASPIDERLLSSPVFLAQHGILLAAPALVQLAETGVAIAVRVGPAGTPLIATAELGVDGTAAACEARRSLASVTRPAGAVVGRRTTRLQAGLRPNHS